MTSKVKKMRGADTLWRRDPAPFLPGVILIAIHFSVLLGGLLGGCASSPKVKPGSPAPLTQNGATQNGATQEGAAPLSAQYLRAGECGLFVFSAGNERRFMLYSSTATQSGRWQKGSAEQSLTLTAFEGSAKQGQYPVQSLLAKDGTQLSLDLGRGAAVTNGTRYIAARLKITEPEGWERIIPIYALSSCASEG